MYCKIFRMLGMIKSIKKNGRINLNFRPDEFSFGRIDLNVVQDEFICVARYFHAWQKEEN